MTKQEILSIAKEAGFDGLVITARDDYDDKKFCEVYSEELERFAELVAAVEREACAKAASDVLTQGRSPLGRLVADAIRARQNLLNKNPAS